MHATARPPCYNVLLTKVEPMTTSDTTALVLVAVVLVGLLPVFDEMIAQMFRKR